MKRAVPLFEMILSIPAEEFDYSLRGYGLIPWADFLLNPRRLRGSDFLMRWSQGKWSEERLTQAVETTGSYIARPYGPSGVAPDGDVRQFELYFERLERAGLGRLKRPDLLVFKRSDAETVDNAIRQLGGAQELPFTPESERTVKALLEKAVIAVECENSLWIAAKMPDYNATLKSQKRLKGQLGLKKSAVLPTVILKEEDRKPLLGWQRQHGIPIHIWHVFYDRAYGIALLDVERLIRGRRIEATKQIFQAPGGATTTKLIYKIYHHYAYQLAETEEEPKLLAAHLTDKNGHILPYVRFEGGNLLLTSEAKRVLSQVAGKPPSR